MLLCALCLGAASLNGPSTLALHFLIMLLPEARALKGLAFSSRNTVVSPHWSHIFPVPLLRSLLISASESLFVLLPVVMWLRLFWILATLSQCLPSLKTDPPSLFEHFGGAEQSTYRAPVFPFPLTFQHPFTPRCWYMTLIPMSQQSMLLCALCLGAASLNGPSALALHFLIMLLPEARALKGLAFSSRNKVVSPHWSHSFPVPLLRSLLILASESLFELLPVVMWLRLFWIL